MQIEEAFQTVSVALPPDLEVRFVHGRSGSEAFIRRLDAARADDYALRLKSWDDSRTERAVIENNLIRRVLGAFGPKRRTPQARSERGGLRK